jgi:membrane-associated phospholipid phosphatase
MASNKNFAADDLVARKNLISRGNLQVDGTSFLNTLCTQSIESTTGTAVNGVVFQDNNVTVPGNLVVEGTFSNKKSLVAPTSADNRREAAYTKRATAAFNEYLRGYDERPNNGDEELYANKMSQFSKSLPHDSLGNVDLDAYEAMLDAINSGAPSDFDLIPMGSNPSVKLTNPQAALAFDLEGSDPFAIGMLPAPTFDSAQQAGETVELYCMALMRDVSFSDYQLSPLATSACAYLNACSDFRGPKVFGSVTPSTLFRGSLSGNLTGPYISQFLYQPFHYGAVPVDQKSRQTTVDADYATTFNDWLQLQNGATTVQPSWPSARYMINARDLAEWVHMDALYQGYHHALLYLLGIGCPTNVGNPYNSNATQVGFGTLGPPDILALLPEISSRALKAAWNQKWCVSRRTRPDGFCSRVHLTKTFVTSDPIHTDLLNSGVLTDVYNKWASYLMPLSYVEGSPTHPSYPAGHATVAGACVTLLKAWFDTSGNIPNPVQPNANGSLLLPYMGTLNIQDELHKLACNISSGRNMAGIHYRSDMDESLKLGEEICISVLRDRKPLYNENFAGFTFTKFDGTVITV